MQATLSARSLRSYLPRGQTLPADAFARRQRWMFRLLLAHVVALPLFGVAQGYSLGHSLVEVLPLVAIAFAVTRFENRRVVASLTAIGLLTCSALLVHLWHGAIEAHFHFFVMIPLLALYEDWLPFLLAVAYVALHHGAAGALDPGSVYNHADAVRHPWKWAGVHGMFVAAAGAVSLVTWRLNEEMREQTRRESSRRAEAEAVAATLQRGLRPDRLPALAAGTVAARYRPADTREIGGDWYDVLALPDGRVALTLGDVAGHGIQAASQMAALRHAVRAFAHEGSAPAEVAHRIDRIFEGEFATFVYLVFDPRAGELRYANAGHLPPLVVSGNGGGATFLWEPLSLPLGLERDVQFDEGVADLPPGATVLVYTDGLVERRTARIDRQLMRLQAALAETSPVPEETCDRALAAFPPDGSDDVAVLAFRAGPGAQESFAVPADPMALAGAREHLRAWLTELRVDGPMASELVLAADEALTNAIVHSGSDRIVEVELGCRDGTVQITVRDFGCWSPDPSDPDHGRGLLLADALTDELDVIATADGTTVTMSRRVGEAAGAAAAPDAVEAAAR